MIDTAKFENILRERRSYLEGKLRKYEASLEQQKSADFEERATETENDEVIEDLGNAGLAEIRMIDAALKRIEDGTYGTCPTCGNQISVERLEALPHTPLCRFCA